MTPYLQPNTSGLQAACFHCKNCFLHSSDRVTRNVGTGILLDSCQDFYKKKEVQFLPHIVIEIIHTGSQDECIKYAQDIKRDNPTKKLIVTSANLKN